ncbi:MAG: HEAT repeat domain-containing protein [Gemmatimonadetes bacterium]|nr:HEAT repeat domain-containing protein [Gemmatimonadota bacterium]
MARASIPALLKQLRGRNPESRSRAAAALGERARQTPDAFRDGPTVSLLTQLLGHSGDWSVRMCALQVLEKAAPEEAVRRVVRGLSHPDRRRRAAAARRLHQIVTMLPDRMGMALRDGARPALLDAARSTDRQVRNNAVQALGLLKVEEAIPLMVEALAEEDDPFLPGTAAIALADFGRKAAPALPALVRLLDTNDAAHAAGALGGLGAAGADAIPHLERALAGAREAGDDELVEECRDALGKLRRAAKARRSADG